jgi:hypothetical protein
MSLHDLHIRKRRLRKINDIDPARDPGFSQRKLQSKLCPLQCLFLFMIFLKKYQGGGGQWREAEVMEMKHPQVRCTGLTLQGLGTVIHSV